MGAGWRDTFWWWRVFNCLKGFEAAVAKPLLFFVFLFQFEDFRS
jgi:hypothetical protein